MLTQQTWAGSGHTEKRKPGQAGYGSTVGRPDTEKRGHYFTEEEEEVGGVAPDANVLEKLRSPV